MQNDYVRLLISAGIILYDFDYDNILHLFVKYVFQLFLTFIGIKILGKLAVIFIYWGHLYSLDQINPYEKEITFQQLGTF